MEITNCVKAKVSVVILLVLICFSGCMGKPNRDVVSEGNDKSTVDYGELVEYKDGEYHISDSCDWLTAELRFRWDTAFNDDRAAFIEYFNATYPEKDSNYRDKAYLSFLGECLQVTITQQMTPDAFLSDSLNKMYGDSWDDIVYKYLEIVNNNGNFNYQTSEYLYNMLNHEINDGCIDVSRYSDSFQGYSAKEMGMMEYVVNWVEQNPSLGPFAMMDQISDHYAKTDKFLFYVYAIQWIDGRECDFDLLFEYDVHTKSISYIDILDPTDNYWGEPIYAVENIPDGYMDESAVQAYQSYLNENGWYY